METNLNYIDYNLLEFFYGFIHDNSTAFFWLAVALIAVTCGDSLIDSEYWKKKEKWECGWSLSLSLIKWIIEFLFMLLMGLIALLIKLFLRSIALKKLSKTTTRDILNTPLLSETVDSEKDSSDLVLTPEEVEEMLELVKEIKLLEDLIATRWGYIQFTSGLFGTWGIFEYIFNMYDSLALSRFLGLDDSWVPAIGAGIIGASIAVNGLIYFLGLESNIKELAELIAKLDQFKKKTSNVACKKFG